MKGMLGMKRLIISTAAVAAGLVLAACGSGGSSTAAPGTGGGAGNGTTVSVKQVGGLRNVLVDANGKVLYSPDQEADGKVRCTGACTSFWKPLTPGTGVANATSNVGHLAVIQRPDGTKQVTDSGKPLYTFVLDSSGTTKGDGFSDSFGGQQFTWHAVHAGGATSSPPAGATNGGGSGGTSPGGYGY